MILTTDSIKNLSTIISTLDKVNLTSESTNETVFQQELENKVNEDNEDRKIKDDILKQIQDLDAKKGEL